MKLVHSKAEDTPAVCNEKIVCGWPVCNASSKRWIKCSALILFQCHFLPVLTTDVSDGNNRSQFIFN